jgi:trk system potassium uptake protein TrkH
VDRRLIVLGGLFAATIIVGVDLALGDRGWVSWIFTILEAAAAAGWAALVIGNPLKETPPLSTRGPLSIALTARLQTAGQKIRGALVSVIFVLLVFGTLSLKIILLASGGYAPHELTGLYRTYIGMAVFLAAVGYAGRGQRMLWFFGQIAEHPARMLASSLFVVSVFGGFLLATPFALVDPSKGSFVDALFDATGALCGALSVSDVGRQYTFFGQAVVLLWMQIGGFGIMVLSASVAILAGRRMEVRSSARFAETVDADSISDLRATVIRIVLWTIVIEIIGAVLLYFLFSGLPGLDAAPEDPHPLAGGGGPLWSAVFHSVSAFCNAGFALFRGNLAPFVSDPGVNVVVCSLIVLGGLGFPVLSELTGRAIDFVARRPRKRLSLHARVVLVMTAILIVAGAVPILALEWSRGLSQLPVVGKLLAAFFQSITARTAGFSSVELATFTAPSLLLMIALMFIGAGPGSTGGGIKVTTFAVLFATFRAERASAAAPTLFGREIPASTQRKAIVVTFLSAVLVCAVVFLVLIFEDQPPLFVLYEATSAFGSVGCSTGIEAKMGPVGKILLTLTMMIGRIGPLTFALAAAGKPRTTTLRLPEERVMIG